MILEDVIEYGTDLAIGWRSVGQIPTHSLNFAGVATIVKREEHCKVCRPQHAENCINSMSHVSLYFDHVRPICDLIDLSKSEL